MKMKKTLKETVVEGIYREIEEGIYKPNDIIHEGEIMEKYAMSKSPVREALIELCKDTKGGLSGGSCDPEGDTGSSGIQN